MDDIDFDYIGSYLFETTADPAEMIPNEDVFDGLADAPPPISGYREADVAGVACWGCGHFTAVGDVDGDGDIDGICNLFEARAEGQMTCDRFTAHADLFRQSPHTSWTEDLANAAHDSMGASIESVNYSDGASLAEIFLSSAAVEEDGLVWKDILRTGEWSHTPTKQGMIKKKLQIIRDGASDPNAGIISLSEIYRNFEDRAVPYVTIPLSDDVIDHKNIARLNTGFVRKLKLEDRDGVSMLVAGMEFTEPDVKEKVLRGTIPDVSAGVPYGVTRRKDNRFFNTVLDHVCLTVKPFVSDLSPFGIAAADSEVELPVETWEEEIVPEPQPTPKPTDQNVISLTFRQQQVAIQNALASQLRLSADYVVEDIDPNKTLVTISHKTSGVSWTVPFKLLEDSDSPVRLASVDRWQTVEREPVVEPPSEVSAADSELQQARELRELRLAQPTSTGGVNMSISAPALDGLGLSDEQRERVQAVFAENDTLRRKNKTNTVDSRITELEGLGLKDRPGALKFYREVMLSDDDGPAIVLFADQEDDSKKERLSAIAILDRFIAALEADGGVVFSDQALQSGNDNRPPRDASDERSPLEERVAEAQTALYGSGKRRTGRK